MWKSFTTQFAHRELYLNVWNSKRHQNIELYYNKQTNKTLVQIILVKFLYFLLRQKFLKSYWLLSVDIWCLGSSINDVTQFSIFLICFLIVTCSLQVFSDYSFFFKKKGYLLTALSSKNHWPIPLCRDVIYGRPLTVLKPLIYKRHATTSCKQTFINWKKG
jgi:hypothetical protein